MAYAKIPNLYKGQSILMFKEVFALCKVHGSSSHITFKNICDVQPDFPQPSIFHEELNFYAGGVKHDLFVKLFDDKLFDKFREIVDYSLRQEISVTVYGEVYGGKCQKMSKVYGPLNFIAFEVKIGDTWLNVPDAEEFVLKLGLTFVPYERIPCTLEAIDRERDRPSVVAQWNGMGDNHIREGVVLRPLEEMTKNNGQRIMCKHKRDEFMETRTPRKVDPTKLKVLSEAKEVANEWATNRRLEHVLDKIEEPDITKMGEILKAMVEDIRAESTGEIEWSREVSKAICSKTAVMYKERLNENLINS